MNKKTKIFVLTNTLLNGGAEKQALILAQTMREYNLTQVIVYYGEQIDPRLELFVNENGIDILRLKGRHLTKIAKIYKLLKHNKNSVIFSYLATTNLLNGFLGKLAGIKYRIGGIRSSKIEGTKMFVQRFLHNHVLSYSIFNCDSGMTNMLNKGFNKKKSLYIPNCIELPKNKEKKQNDKIVILSVGRFVEAKDYLTSLKVIKKCYESHQNINYLLIGYGELEKQIREWVANLDLCDIVDIIINPKNVMEYYRDSDIYLSTSIFEGTSNSIMEALSYSLPVVATDVGDNNKLIIDGYNGLLTIVEDIDEMSNKLNNLISDINLRIKYGKNGYNHIKENFSKKAFIDSYLKLIERITG